MNLKVNGKYYFSISYINPALTEFGDGNIYIEFATSDGKRREEDVSSISAKEEENINLESKIKGDLAISPQLLDIDKLASLAHEEYECSKLKRRLK